MSTYIAAEPAKLTCRGGWRDVQFRKAVMPPRSGAAGWFGGAHAPSTFVFHASQSIFLQAPLGPMWLIQLLLFQFNRVQGVAPQSIRADPSYQT